MQVHATGAFLLDDAPPKPVIGLTSAFFASGAMPHTFRTKTGVMHGTSGPGTRDGGGKGAWSYVFAIPGRALETPTADCGSATCTVETPAKGCCANTYKYVHIDTRVGTVQYTCMAKPDVDQGCGGGFMGRQMDSVYGELLCGCGRYYNGSAVTVL